MISVDDAFAAVTLATAPFGGALAGGPAPTPWTRCFSRCRRPRRTGTYVLVLALARRGTPTRGPTRSRSTPLTNPTYMGPTGPDDVRVLRLRLDGHYLRRSAVIRLVRHRAPGPGTLITEITDEDAGIVTLSTMFSVKYYGRGLHQRLDELERVPRDGDVRLPVRGQLGDTRRARASGDDRPVLGRPRPLGRRGHLPLVRLPGQALDLPVRRGRAVGDEPGADVPGHHHERGPIPDAHGDSPILIQYETVTMPYGCTVDRDHSQTDGIEWLYDGTTRRRLCR